MSQKNNNMKYIFDCFLCICILFFGGVRGSGAVVMTHGPLVGGVTENSAKIFVRTESSAVVRIKYSKKKNLRRHKLSHRILTKGRHDYCAIIKLESLEPFTRYYYTPVIDGEPQILSDYPHFSTFLPKDSLLPFSFVVLSDLCMKRSNPNQPRSASVYKTVHLLEKPSLVLQIGDFDHRNPEKLDEHRRMHKDLRDPNIDVGRQFLKYIAWHYPFFHVWDDHDFGKNNADKNFRFKKAALRAFKEYFPTPDLPNPDAGIWHNFRYGQAEFFMLDVRSQRDKNKAPQGPDKSMLDGDEILNGQKEWLKENLLVSDARWKFIISPVPFNETSKLRDSWAAFRTERQELVDFIRTNLISGVVIVSGDIHSGGAIDDGLNSDFPEISVPHMNRGLPPETWSGDCVGKCGDWSEGVIPGAGNPGYAMIYVDENQLVLQIKGKDGDLRKEFIVNADTY